VDSDVIVEVIKIVPTLLWILFIAALVMFFRKPIQDEVLPRLGGVSAFGIELKFAREELDKAVEKQTVVVSKEDRSMVFKRAQNITNALQGAQILWVDDNPDWILDERRILRSFGIFVDVARSTEEALSVLEQTDYNAVISDMERGENRNAGRELLAEMRVRRLYRWMIFYVGDFDESRGIPPYAFGMTNRPDHLLHYVMDVIERDRS
jgi:CheY-like chemotaxis protein